MIVHETKKMEREKVFNFQLKVCGRECRYDSLIRHQVPWALGKDMRLWGDRKDGNAYHIRMTVTGSTLEYVKVLT